MGYSRSRDVLRQMIPQLKQVLDQEIKGWELDDQQQARTWAYKIREALKIASLYPEEFPEYARMAQNYKVIERSQYVLLELKERRQVTPVGIKGVLRVPTTSVGPTAKVVSEEELAAPHTDVQVDKSVENMIAICSATKREREVFRNAKLSNTDMIRLYEWAQAQEPKWMIFSAMGDVTLRHWTSEYEGTDWTPEDL